MLCMGGGMQPVGCIEWGDTHRSKLGVVGLSHGLIALPTRVGGGVCVRVFTLCPVVNSES